MRRWALAALLVLLSASSGGAAEVEQTLIDAGHLNAASVVASGALVQKTGSALLIRTDHEADDPGITLNAPALPWDLSHFAFVALDLKNAGSQPLSITCRITNPGPGSMDHSVGGTVTLAAGHSSELKLPLPGWSPTRVGTMGAAKSAGMLFGMRGYPKEFSADLIYSNATMAQPSLDPSRVNAVLISFERQSADGLLQINRIWAGGKSASALAAHLFPLLDTFGQYIHRDWPGKTHTLAELESMEAREAKELHEFAGPPDWDRYGGWSAGPTLEKTGFFRTQKYQGKWWLVDPLGHLFFSHGIDCVGRLDATAIDDRGAWFANFPGYDPAFHEFLYSGYSLKGYYAGHNPKVFSFAAANLKRRFGDAWPVQAAKLDQQRLRSWGINTIGNWSNPSVYSLRTTPYVMSFYGGWSRRIAGSRGYWGKFPDPFDPAFRTGLQKSVSEEIGKSIGDPWCIGYFVGNEMAWATSSTDETSLSLAVLHSPADQPAKTAFTDDLKRKYGDVAQLNQAWGTGFASWDDLLGQNSDPQTALAKADLATFYSRLADQYFSTVRDVLKAAAPHQLYLGCRFAWNCPRARTAAAKYCDVVSFNLYNRSEANFKFPEGDVPVLIGEFHFGALDRGLFHTGLVATASQQERAEAYRQYVRSVLKNPVFIGCHWFQYQDEPTTGRAYDGENYQIGFVDVADNPYPELVRASRDIGYSMYLTRLQK